MNKTAHLSIRLTAREKRSLERLAAAEDLSVGQLIRRALGRITDAALKPPSIVHPPGRRRRHAAAIDRQREIRWLTEHAQELARFAGEWIILEGNEVIAHGEDYLEVLARARKRGIRIPFVERVPHPKPTSSTMGL